MDKLKVREVPFKGWSQFFNKGFDPTKDDLPKGMHEICHVQYSRIKPLISRFSLQELNYAMNCIHEISRRMDDFYSDIILDRMRAEGKGSSGPFLEFQAFKEYRSIIDLDTIFKQMPGNKVKWSEFYALYALRWLNELVGIYLKKDLPPAPEDAHEITKLNNLYDRVGYDAYLMSYLVTITDALSAAEVYAEKQTEGLKGGKSRISQGKFPMLKEKIKSIWQAQYQGKSNRQAARLIFDKHLTEEDKKVFRTDDPTSVTIERWIAEFRSKS